MKVGHFSDLHYSGERIKEAGRCFDAAVTEAIASNIDCAIITGDSTDHAMDAHAPAVRELARQVRRLSDHCPVLLLQGTFSHEPPGFLHMLAMVRGKYEVAVADTIGHWALDDERFAPYSEGSNPRLLVSAMPTLNKAAVASLVTEPGEAEEQARAIIARVIRGWSGLHREMYAQGVPTVVLSHGTVFNSISEHGVPMAGTDHELGLDTLRDCEADAVMLGHIHMHQFWEQELDQGRKQIVAYAGSIGRFHYGEIGDKGWLLWDLKPGSNSVGFEFKPTPARRNVEFVFEGPPDLEEIKARAGECCGSYVRIRYTVDEEHRHHVNRTVIREILKSAEEIKIEGRTYMVQRQRAAGISGASSLAAKLKMWAEATETPGVEALVERLEMVAANAADVVAEEVATRVLSACP